MRVFLGWLRGERGHCGMVAIPTMEEEDARRPSRACPFCDDATQWHIARGLALQVTDGAGLI
jgi:hypothetical protein